MKGVAFPYPTYRKPLTMDLGVRLDGKTVHAEKIVPMERVVDLRADDDEESPGPEWNRMELEVTVEAADRENLEELEASGYQLDVVAILECRGTELRQSQLLAQQEGSTTRWRGRVGADLDSLYGTCTVKAKLAGVKAGDERASQLAESGFYSWTIAIDEPVPHTRHGHIRVKWQQFGESEDPRIRHFRSEMFYLELDRKQPVLWLNDDLSWLRLVLEDRRRRGTDAALHDLLRFDIAKTAQVLLFQDAALAVELDRSGEEPGVPLPPPESWQRNALQELLQILPDPRSADEGLDYIAAAKEESSELQRLLADIAAAVELKAKAGKHTGAAVGRAGQ